MIGSSDQPDYERDVIVQEIEASRAARWGLFVGLELERHGLSQREAESVSAAIADNRRVTAWLMLGPGQYKRLR